MLCQLFSQSVELGLGIEPVLYVLENSRT